MHMPTESRTAAVPIACVLLTALLSAGCVPEPAGKAAVEPPPVGIGGEDELNLGEPPAQLPEILQLPEPGSGDSPESWPVRSRNQREASVRFGSQSGFRRRSWELRNLIRERSGELSAVFDFNRLVRAAPGGAGYLVPPVVQRAGNAFLSEGNGTTVSVADAYLRILKPEWIAPVAPNWRDWLLFSPPPATPLPVSLAPATDGERRQVRAWIEQGWNAGMKQAEHEFAERLRRLRRDYEGMLEFRRLAALGMIDGTDLADADFGVTGEPGEMRIGSRVVRIVGTADFVRDPAEWRRLPNREPALHDAAPDGG